MKRQSAVGEYSQMTASSSSPQRCRAVPLLPATLRSGEPEHPLGSGVTRGNEMYRSQRLLIALVGAAALGAPVSGTVSTSSAAPPAPAPQVTTLRLDGATPTSTASPTSAASPDPRVAVAPGGWPRAARGPATRGPSWVPDPVTGSACPVRGGPPRSSPRPGRRTAGTVRPSSPSRPRTSRPWGPTRLPPPGPTGTAAGRSSSRRWPPGSLTSRRWPSSATWTRTRCRPRTRRWPSSPRWA